MRVRPGGTRRDPHPGGRGQEVLAVAGQEPAAEAAAGRRAARGRGVPRAAVPARLPRCQHLLLPAAPARRLPWLHSHRPPAVHDIRTRHHRRDQLSGGRHRLARRRRPLRHASTQRSPGPNQGVHLRPQPRRQGGLRAGAGPRQARAPARRPRRRRPGGRHGRGQADAAADPHRPERVPARRGPRHGHRHGTRRASRRPAAPAVRAPGRQPRRVLRRVRGAGVPPGGEGLRPHGHDGRRHAGRQGVADTRAVPERRGQGADEAVRRRRRRRVPEEVGGRRRRGAGRRQGTAGDGARGAVRRGVS